MSTRINIGCATDKNYAQHLGVMIYSLLVNCSQTNILDFYIVDGGIDSSDREKFLSMRDKFGINIFFLKPDRSYFDKLKVFEIYSEATYYRYFLLDTISVDRILFLDCDMVIEGDIVELYNVDLKSNIIAAVLEVLSSEKHLEKINLKFSFNAGMMLVDCCKWQENKISKKAYNFQIENEGLLKYPDQDSLNFILKDYWLMVPYRWNVIARLKLVKYGIGNADYRYISKNELFNEYSNPKIIHYANRLFKPWYWLDPSPYKKNYKYYKSNSPWYSIPYVDSGFFGVLKRLKFYFTFIIKYSFGT
ncbi:MAG: glycosyltransferase family 8 protein [Bacteroidota bacterium]|jgi:lipopolysaccharide biosynthesis glycosyltransferase